MKIKSETNFRVTVEPRRLGDYGFVRTSDDAFGRSREDIAKDYRSRCEDIAVDIKRHCDNVGSVNVECDTEDICSFCGRTWEVSMDNMDIDFPTGTPYCCQKAIDEFKCQKV